MKKFLITLACALTLLTSCKDDDNDSGSGADTYMKAKVDGQVLDVTGSGTPTDTRGTTSIFQESNSTFYLYGNNGDILLAIAVDEFPKATGTFTLGDIKTGRLGNYTDNSDPENPVEYYSTAGTLTITKFDGKTVEGTFSYKAYNTSLKKEVSVTDGQFRAPFTEI
jgi:hypothetical protein